MSDVEPRPDDDIRGQNPPRPAVEFHGHPAGPLLA
jgi:hypothetical protein